MWSLVRSVLGLAGFTLWYNFSETFGYNTNETFPVFIDLFTFLSLIWGFPDASETLENQVNATWVYFEFTPMRLSALRKLIFGVHACKKCLFEWQKKLVDRLNFTTKFVVNIPE